MTSIPKLLSNIISKPILKSTPILPSCTYKTIIFLDWDDTLFPTTWIMQNNIDLITKYNFNHYTLFSKLDNILYKLLLKLQTYGKIIIVTNAILKWVNISLSLLPRTDHLINKSILMISAREICQKNSIDNILIWKNIIFANLIKKERV